MNNKLIIGLVVAAGAAVFLLSRKSSAAETEEYAGEGEGAGAAPPDQTAPSSGGGGGGGGGGAAVYNPASPASGATQAATTSSDAMTAQQQPGATVPMSSGQNTMTNLVTQTRASTVDSGTYKGTGSPRARSASQQALASESRKVGDMGYRVGPSQRKDARLGPDVFRTKGTSFWKVSIPGVQQQQSSGRSQMERAGTERGAKRAEDIAAGKSRSRQTSSTPSTSSSDGGMSKFRSASGGKTSVSTKRPF